MNEQQQIPTSEVLNRAADVLQRDGWMQGGGGAQEYDKPSPTCAVIAIRRTEGSTFPGCVLAENALATHIGGWTFRDVYTWNDTPGRTAAEVIEVLRAVAVIEAAREEQAAKVEVSA